MLGSFDFIDWMLFAGVALMAVTGHWALDIDGLWLIGALICVPAMYRLCRDLFTGGDRT